MDLELGGDVGRFLVDTGAEGNLADPEWLAYVSWSDGGFGTINFGEVRRRAIFEEMFVGGVRLLNTLFTECVMDPDAHGILLDGLIGNNVLRHFAYSIDYARAVLQLDYWRHDEPGVRAEALVSDHQLPVIAVDIAGVQVACLIDTAAISRGIPGTSIDGNPAFLRALGREFKHVGTGTVGGAGKEELVVSKTFEASLPFEFAGQPVHPAYLTVQEAPHPGAFLSADEPRVLIGASLLQTLSGAICVDHREQILWVKAT